MGPRVWGGDRYWLVLLCGPWLPEVPLDTWTWIPCDDDVRVFQAVENVCLGISLEKETFKNPKPYMLDPI